ncbi:hypothetical protein AA313_de0200642 [Arthrobotrys entomopaga]|nr:hypothetical protein AA313_de0200642 [Arthrobotrys entomopaga]
MADQAATSTNTNDRPERGGRGGPRNRGSRGDYRRRGGNGGGRGNSDAAASHSHDNSRSIDPENRRGRGGRGGGGGRGGRGGARGNHSQQQSQSQLLPSIDTTAETLSNIPTAEQPAAEAADAKDPPSPSSTEDGDICFICANPIQYHSIAPCNHMTCHICALRMRALYKTKQCPHCRTNSDFVIFTTNATKTFEEYRPEDIAAQDEALGIKYEGKQIRADTDLCSRFKKVFTHEHTLFTFNALKKHEKYGDDVPGAEDQSGFKGHPECEFCHKRFYGDDELYAHCKEAHERCFICDRDTSRRPQYFINWEALEQHFKKEHFRCTDAECLEKKFIVFASEMDLRAHVLEEHPGGLSKGALKDMRKVDMTAFPDSHGHGGSGSGSGSRGRGGRMQRDYRRDQQLPEPTPPDTGPLRRDEIAFQRTLAVQTAQTTVPPRMFGGQLTRPAPQPVEQPAARPAQAAPAQPPVSQPTRQPVRQQDAFPPLGSLNISSPPSAPVARAPANVRPPAPAQAQTPAPQPSVPSNVSASTAQKHEAVLTRATRLLNNDSSKLEKFKKYISNYNSEQLTAKDLIEAFWVLFDVKATDLATLLRELSELFEKEDKRRALLEAWNEWKSVNEDYPPMPGGIGGSSSAAGAGGARVLKLKSATSRNLRAGASPWSAVTSRTIERGGGSLAEINGGGARYGVPGSAVTVAGKGKAPASAPTPWASAVRNPGASSSGSSGAGRGMRPAPTPAAVVTNKSEFPSLPKLVPKYAPVIRKGEGSGPASVWGGSSSVGAGSAADANGGQGGDDVLVVGTKGKGKKKQTIIQWG